MIWQLLKGLYEVGCDNIVVPYRGEAFRSLWWRCYPNPAKIEGELYARAESNLKFQSVRNNTGFLKDRIIPKAVQLAIIPKWRRLLQRILRRENEIDAALIVGVPLNQIRGIGKFIKESFNCPTIYYDLDVPTSLQKFGGFSFNYFHGADLGEYDAIISPSEGVTKDLFEQGATRIEFVHFGVDPDLYIPVETHQDVDIFFYATSGRNREKSIEMMISDPSKVLDANFLVSGLQFKVDLGRAKKISMVPFSKWRNFCCRSKVNLNIPRVNHASTYATSTSRPFELAAMGCCIVSSPYYGLEKWFEIGSEILVAENSEEAISLYQWLLEDDEARTKLGESARRRVLKEHTYKHRAHDLLRILSSIS